MKQPFVKVIFDLSDPDQEELYKEIKGYNPLYCRSMGKYIICQLLKLKQLQQMEQELLQKRSNDVMATTRRQEEKVENEPMNLPKSSNHSPEQKEKVEAKNEEEDYLNFENVDDSFLNIIGG